MRSISVVALCACFGILTACGGSTSSPANEAVDSPTVVQCQDANNDSVCDSANQEADSLYGTGNYSDPYGSNGCTCPAGFILVTQTQRAYNGTRNEIPRCVRKATLSYSQSTVSIRYKKRPGRDSRLTVDAAYDHLGEDYEETVNPSGANCQAVVTCNPFTTRQCGGNGTYGVCSQVSGHNYGTCQDNSYFN